MGCGTAGRCRHRPLRKRILWCVGEGLCPSRGRPQGSPLRKRYKRCGEGKNPPVTASPCQPPLGKGAMETGGRIATGALHPRNDMVFTRGQCKAGRRDTWVPPYGRVTRGAVGRADVGIGPYERSQEVQWLLGGAMWWGAAPTDVLQGVRGKWRIYRGLPGEGQREGNFWLNLGEGREVF